MTRRTFAALAAGAAVAEAQAKEMPWTQWGGPNRNFHTDAAGIASQFPASGPRVMWKRKLGEGYSAILADAGVLYTMYGRRGEEVALAANAATGATIWERVNPVRFRSDAPERGDGPHATPLLTGGRLYTVGVTGRLECLDPKSGKLIWTQALWENLRGDRLRYGYASSPLAYRDLLLLPIGGSGQAMAAFRQNDGSVVWKKNSAGAAYSSPITITVDGLDQVVQFMERSVFAVNPLNGDLQWAIPHTTEYGLNVATPVWGAGNMLFIASAYGSGSRGIELKRSGNGVTATERWYTQRAGLHHGNAIRIGDTVYFSAGMGPAPFTAIDVKSGAILWQNRTFPKCNMVYADSKLIVLDEDGNLALAQPSPQEVKVLAKAPLLENNAWTPPTLAGSKLYIRDRQSMVAVDLAS